MFLFTHIHGLENVYRIIENLIKLYKHGTSKKEFSIWIDLFIFCWVILNNSLKNQRDKLNNLETIIIIIKTPFFVSFKEMNK